MAKRKSSKSRVAHVPSLKPHITRSLKVAKGLRGKVAKPDDLEDLIGHLEGLQASAQNNCPVGSGWSRKFALAAPAKKASRKSAKKR
jgi:hypothetical protein